MKRDYRYNSNTERRIKMLTVDKEKIEILQAKKGIPSEELSAITGLTRGTIYSMKMVSHANR